MSDTTQYETDTGPDAVTAYEQRAAVVRDVVRHSDATSIEAWMFLLLNEVAVVRDTLASMGTRVTVPDEVKDLIQRQHHFLDEAEEEMREYRDGEEWKADDSDG